MVALAVGEIRALGLLAQRLHGTGVFWNSVRILNNHFGLAGYCIVALFVASWIFSIAIYRWRRFDSLDFNATAATPPLHLRETKTTAM